jgi:hypothetical protein
MRAFKFLSKGAIGRFSDFAWPQPERDEHGAWVSGGLPELCLVGVHACRLTDLTEWIDDELWEIELDGEIREELSMVVGERGRLVRRVDEWDSSCAEEFTQACIWRARATTVRALRRDAVDSEADRLEAAEDIVDVQLLGAIASRHPEAPSAAVAGYAADAVAIARGRRPDEWRLSIAFADVLPPETASARAANVGWVVAHIAALDLMAETGDDAAYPSGFAAERAWQLRWLKERLELRV